MVSFDWLAENNPFGEPVELLAFQVKVETVEAQFCVLTLFFIIHDALQMFVL